VDGALGVRRMSRKFNLTIDLENAAFGEPDAEWSRNFQIGRILKNVAVTLEERGELPGIVDLNGNTVGKVEITGIQEKEEAA